jgi:ketosteroid isomerase-like protein
MELVADDFVWLPPDEPIVEGKDALRAWVEKFPPIKKFSSTLVRAEGRDDFACPRGTFAVTVESKSGESLLMKGKWTRSYRKQPDGSWLCASDTWNLDEPPKAE